MEENANLLSLRIFTADHYMTVPSAGLDSNYSEFRSEPIRQVCVNVSDILTLCLLNGHFIKYVYNNNTNTVGAYNSNIRHGFAWHQNLCSCTWCISVLVHTVPWQN